ncbi:hypothetical protein K443DRAFT_682900 [Laccaria amethystina LaAM-08-1]|uniref:Uncharacterized protein n=1 Tax=Laccaria amethystina LaAM-08-1 TaxID=1095629 RepID=A0A0C9WU31_9AGAR|nr:hypothetical protein K443DRAFT_682900 [Laccaria amethystina LaAM-08-1]
MKSLSKALRKLVYSLADISLILAFLLLSSMSHEQSMLTSSGTLGLMWAMLELSYREFSWSRPRLRLSDHSRLWRKQRVVTTQQIHRLTAEAGSFVNRGPFLTIVLNNSLTPKSPRTRHIFAL